MKKILQKIYIIVLIEDILFIIISKYLQMKSIEVGAFLGGSIVFLLLFRHLEVVVKNFIPLEGETTKNNRKLIFSYFIRFLLIIIFFYATIKISKRVFLVAMLGFIVSSLSLLIFGLSLIFKGDGDGRA